jgi:hypothetical protein
MQLVRIVENEQKPFGKGGLGQKLTFLSNGKQRFINVFDSSPVIEQIAALVAGNELELEIGKDPTGKYDQIDVVGPVLNVNANTTTVTSDVPVQVSSPYTNNQDAQRKSIERQVSLKTAVELCINGKYKTTDEAVTVIIATAEKFYDYLVFKEQE